MQVGEAHEGMHMHMLKTGAQQHSEHQTTPPAHRFSALAGEQAAVHNPPVLLAGPPNHWVLKPQPVPRAAAAGRVAAETLVHAPAPK